MQFKALLAVAAVASIMGPLSSAEARDQIRIVGSSTVFPFSTAVAEEYGNRNEGLPTPVVESTGTGGGMKLFCEGLGPEHPDITNASRRIKQSELERCANNGVDELIEVNIGFDGIVLAASKGASTFRLTKQQIFLALAKDVPANADGSELQPNPYVRWSDIDISLPGAEIRVFGPPPTSGTRDAFAELAMEGGCKTFPGIVALKDTDEDRYDAICQAVREDGAYLEAGENDNLIVQKLAVNRDSLGIFGFSFLDQNGDTVTGAYIDDTLPSFETIADGRYPLSRPLYFYVKKAHVGEIPGIDTFLDMFVDDAASGEFGYLTDKGLIPLPTVDRDALKDTVKNLTPLTM